MDYSKFKDVEEYRAYMAALNPSRIDESVTVTEKEETEEQSKEKEGDDENKSEKDADANSALKNSDAEFAKYDRYENIFKHIIVFTNDKDPKNNKTLKNIFDAIKNLKKAGAEVIPELHLFTAAEVIGDEEDDEITIKDKEGEFTIKDENNYDTLVFARLSVQGEDNCEHIVELLQDRGFLVLNPVKYASVASNKYESAKLFEKGEIPQPNFCLMTKDILYDEKLFNESMKRLYPKWDTKDADKNKDFDIVCKILDGHGGTGVALIDGKRLTAWLQMVFAIDAERSLILQKREEADGGDLRVHVLTLRDKQVILAAMKRVQIKNDFRSNVSLGASAEKVELTDEQKEIALNTAKLSCMPWCAVDIMPIKKNDNGHENVVLEINASPGTDGISDVIEYNFVNVLLNELNDPKQFYLQTKTAGYYESVSVKITDDGKAFDMRGLLDSGNGTKASQIEVGEFNYDEKKKKVSFKLFDTDYELDVIDESHPVHGQGGKSEVRPIVKIAEIKIGKRIVKDVEMSLVAKRDVKSSNILLNRTLLGYLGYQIHPDKTHILTTEMEKIKIV